MRAFHRKIQYPHPLGRGVMEQDMEKPSGGKKKPRRFRATGAEYWKRDTGLGRPAPTN